MDLTPLIQPAETKILLVVMDGLGGYADGERGTELEEADTPNLDRIGPVTPDNARDDQEHHSACDQSNPPLPIIPDLLHTGPVNVPVAFFSAAIPKT